MWSGIEKISEQVTRYGTVCGQLWYLLVFIFRMIVVATIGANVYSDEQSAFRCSTKVIGCDNVCYDRFSKISHIRYWAFQLLAVSTPAVLFHFFSLRVRGQIEKLRQMEEERAREVETASMASSVYKGDDKKLMRRKKSVGQMRQKKVYFDDSLSDIVLTRRIQVAYYVTVFMRAIIEIVSLILTYKLFHFTDHTVEPTQNPIEMILIKIPQVYRCAGENVVWACGQHLSLGNKSGYVPCWVSRPYEKTVFMCYMNFLSATCLLLSVVEMIQLSGRVCYHWGRKRYQKIQRAKTHRTHFANGGRTSLINNKLNNSSSDVVESILYQPNEKNLQGIEEKPSNLAIPVRQVSILRNKNEKNPESEKKAKLAKKKKRVEKVLYMRKPIGIRALGSDYSASEEEEQSDDESDTESSELGSVEIASNDSY